MKTLLCLLLVTLTAHALPRDCVHLMAGGEALYWKPCSADFQYGFRFQNLATTKTRQLILNPDYGWGFRAFAHAADRCDINSLTLDWTYIRLTTSNQATGPNTTAADENLLFVYQLTAGSTQALEANASERHKYSKVRLVAGHVFFDSRCGQIYGYFGGRWVDVRERKQLQSVGQVSGTNVFTKQVTQFDGGGIEVGFGGETTPACGFGVTGKLGIAALIGEQKSTANSMRGQDVLVNQRDPSQTICRPALEVRGGIFGIFGCKCVYIRGEIGYQLDYYFRVLRARVPQSSPNNFSGSNVGFGGPYATLGLIF